MLAKGLQKYRVKSQNLTTKKKERKKERNILSRLKQEQSETGNKITQEHY